MVQMTFGIEGPVVGMANAPGVPAHVEAQNITEYMEMPPEPDRRPMRVHKDRSGRLLQTLVMYETETDEPAPYVGFRLGGEVSSDILVACPEAEHRNEACSRFSLVLPGGDASPDAQSLALTDALSALVAHVEDMRVLGCPVHSNLYAPPAALDTLIGYAQLTPDAIG